MLTSTAGAKAFAARVGMFYGALFVVYGMQVPFLPVWLDWRGLTASEISLVMSAPFFLRLIVTPAVALGADRNGSHRFRLVVLAWLSLGFVLALSQMSGFWAIFLMTIPLIICNSTIMPLIETVAVTGVRLGGLDYGRMRLWGSLTFIAASFAGGVVVTAYGAGAGVWLIAIGCLMTVIAAHLLPSSSAAPKAAARTYVPIWKAEEPLALLRQPAFRIFLIAAGLTQAAHATFLAFGALIWQAQGLSGVWIGTLWAVGVLAEVLLFAQSGKVVARIGVVRLLMLAAGASIVRWAVMAFEPGLAVLLPLQILHGVTYGASHIAAIHFLRSAVPQQVSGTAQALYATVAAGLAMGTATMLAGWLYEKGGAASYLAMSVAAAIALMATMRLAALWQGQMLLPDAVDRGAGEKAGGESDEREDARRVPAVPLPPEGGISG